LIELAKQTTSWCSGYYTIV